ncbi:CxxH/CxxC protein [Alkalihalobacillus sp. MEB130]|uniref:CxxH/CxxC protein n=1 Tax=Alkalihalobacillus sp. MEB130 TaxID=2976704 RepID=UPI0028DE8610|nr:CxxH/CxxC protein [Alkalihalobacillus sp. MEB130]MDT8862798.1 CxxH/CxxC protein [Alkalihalobacillus sp. MEB130]
MYYACDEHIEVAIDMIVDEVELAPVVEKINEEKAPLSTTCSFCESVAIYTVDS